METRHSSERRCQSGFVPTSARRTTHIVCESWARRGVARWGMVLALGLAEPCCYTPLCRPGHTQAWSYNLRGLPAVSVQALCAVMQYLRQRHCSDHDETVPPLRTARRRLRHWVSWSGCRPETVLWRLLESTETTGEAVVRFISSE